MKKFIALQPSHWDQQYKENLLRIGNEFTLFIKMYEAPQDHAGRPGPGTSKSKPRIRQYAEGLESIKAFAAEFNFKLFYDTTHEHKCVGVDGEKCTKTFMKMLHQGTDVTNYYKNPERRYKPRVSKEKDDIPELTELQRIATDYAVKRMQEATNVAHH